MTPTQHPQPQYTSTDEDFDFIWKNIESPLIVRDRINVIKTRSRPLTSHTNATAPEKRLPVKCKNVERFPDCRVAGSCNNCSSWEIVSVKPEDGCASFNLIGSQIRSRPLTSHTNAPAPSCPHLGLARVHYPDGDKNEWCCLNPLTEARKATIAKAAREQALENVLGKIWEKTFTPYPVSPDYYVVPWDTVKEIIESLRSTKEP